MSESRSRSSRTSRRTFLKAAAGVTAGTVLAPQSLLAQGAGATRAARAAGVNRAFMLTPEKALEWHRFKADCGPTYTGSPGWKTFTDFVHARLPESGAIDLQHAPRRRAGAGQHLEQGRLAGAGGTDHRHRLA